VIEPITYIALLGVVLVAIAVVRQANTSEGLGKIIAHFQNYAVIVILAVLLKNYSPILRAAEQPSWSILRRAVPYIFFFTLLGGLTLANYYFGCRAISHALAATRYGVAKVIVLCTGYTILLISLIPFVFPS